MDTVTVHQDMYIPTYLCNVIKVVDPQYTDCSSNTLKKITKNPLLQNEINVFDKCKLYIS